MRTKSGEDKRLGKKEREKDREKVEKNNIYQGRKEKWMVVVCGSSR